MALEETLHPHTASCEKRSYQNEILDRSLRIEELFRRDISDLSPKSVNCLREIARESPADYFRMTEFHGNEVVKDLVDRRLVIRSGTRLTLSWDIFRDFVLTDKAPNIPISYIPQANLGKHLQGLRILIQRKKVAFKDLGDELSLTHGSVDNLVRDFVNIGNAETQRSAEIVTLVSQDEASAAATVFDFLRSHVVYRKLVHEIGLNVPFNVEVVIRFMREIYAGADFAERTWHTAARKMLRWFVAFDLATRDGAAYLLKEGSPSPSLPLPSAVGRPLVSDRFLGDAPPEGVVRVAQASAQGVIRRVELEERFGRNAVAAAVRLGVVRPADKPESLACVTADGADATELVRRFAAQTPTVAFVLALLKKNPMIPGHVVGEELAQAFSYRWSPGSMQRTGNALSRWARWVQEPDQPDLL